MPCTRPARLAHVQSVSWTKLSSEVSYATSRITVGRDHVRRPDGSTGPYDWVEATDQVRVAAVVDGGLLLTSQHHYLVGHTLQLPGGNVESDEDPIACAQRELHEETGYHGGTWRLWGALCPLPGLSSMRVHLWSAQDLHLGEACRESAEGDLRVVRVSFAEAARAVESGRVNCLASTTLVLMLARSADHT